MDKHQRYRLKDIEAYRARKRDQAKKDREKRTEYMRGWRERNRERHNELARESYQRRKEDPVHKEARHKNHLRHRYGISTSDYDDMFLSQGGVCAICGKPPGRRRLHIDHCHDSGRIRGLLCTGCNTRLGWWEQHKGAVDVYLS